MAYLFTDASHDFARRPDGSIVPWNRETGGPAGGGAAWARWAADGSPEPVAYVSPPPAIEDYRRAIQAHVDAEAQSRNYDSGITCASYAASTNPTWSAEAAAFIAWRDAVWAHAFAELPKVEAGQREQPTVAAFLSELVPMDWPA